MSYFIYNGNFYQQAEAVIQLSNRSYRYGDGFFETIKVVQGKIPLAGFHQRRIEDSLALTGYALPDRIGVPDIFGEILALCQKNGCSNMARVRLSFSHGDGPLQGKPQPLNYAVEASAFTPVQEGFPVNGLTIGLFPEMQKMADRYAVLKSASAFLFSRAAQYNLQQQWDDSIICNHRGRVCETSIANIFWIKDGKLFTPPLSEGCVAGVMRAFLIQHPGRVTEATCQPETLMDADELLLTNALRGIHWVAQWDKKTYRCEQGRALYDQYIRPLLA
ncbi:aminotransferase class IV [Niabella terrae]